MEAHVAVLRGNEQVTVVRDTQRRGGALAGDGFGGNVERDGARISAGGNYEVIFKLLAVAVVDEIDAGISVLVAHLREVGNVGVPLAGIVADEVVALAFLLARSGNVRCGIGADQLHAQHGRVLIGRFEVGRLQIGEAFTIQRASRCAAQAQHGFIPGEEQSVALSAREKLDLLVALALIRFESQRQLAVVRRYLRAYCRRNLFRE